MATNEELVYRIQNGDASRLLDLWEQNTGMVYKTAQKYAAVCQRSGFMLEDLMQVGYLAMHAAAYAYDSAFSVPFSAFLRKYLKGFMLRAAGWKNGGPPPCVDSLDAPVGTDPDVSTQLDMLEDETAQAPFEAISSQACAPILKDALDRLPKEERSAVYAVFYEGAAQSAVAKPLQRGMRKLRNDHRLCASLEGYITPIWRHTTLSAFKRDMTSSVERAVLQRERIAEEMKVCFAPFSAEKGVENPLGIPSPSKP